MPQVSTKAAPKIIEERKSLAAAGLRAIPSIALEISKPSPIDEQPDEKIAIAAAIAIKPKSVIL